MNKVSIQGRITKDLEVRTVGDGVEVLQFSVAVDNRSGKEKKTDFFECVAWRKSAEFIKTYFKKGDGIILHGAMHNEPYTDKETGKKRDSWKLAISEIDFPLGKSNGGTAPASEPLTEVVDDTDLPF